MLLGINTESRYKALVTALDQFTENMGEYLEDEHGSDEDAKRKECPEYFAAVEILDELNYVRLKANGTAIDSEESDKIAARRSECLKECLRSALEVI